MAWINFLTTVGIIVSLEAAKIDAIIPAVTGT